MVSFDNFARTVSRCVGRNIFLRGSGEIKGTLRAHIETKLNDKRDVFGFHIVNFLFMSSNIPSAPACSVYVSQLIRCVR